jgi:two-component system, sensor histidine kinase PdtaS
MSVSMQNLFVRTRVFGRLPALVRYALTAGLVLVAFGIRYAVGTQLEAYPFLLFFPALIIAAVLFNHGSGIVATLLAAALSAYFFLKPVGSFMIASPDDFLGWWLFVIIGLTMTALIEAQHLAYRELDRTCLELARSHASLADSERDKRELLLEMGHRVMNDFQIAASLLQLQARNAPESVRDEFNAAAARIHAMAKVHSRLSRIDGALTADTRDFITDLCEELRYSLIAVRPIRLEVEAEKHTIALSQAVSLGLIINELVTNALKYAFPDERAGLLSLSFKREGDQFVLRFADDGVGLPRSHDGRAQLPFGVGQRIVVAMVGQLGGGITLEPGEAGTAVSVRFPAV